MNILLLKLSLRALETGHHKTGFWLAQWPYRWQMRVWKYSNKLQEAVTNHYIWK